MMDEQFLVRIRKVFEEVIPFNKLLGLKLVDAGGTRARVAFDFREELVGNTEKRILHGGVICAALDVVGAAAVISSMLDRGPMRSMGTVDLHVDFLRPGSGRRFTATGEVMRPGRLLASTRMELHNDEGILIAIGSAVYRVSTKNDPGRIHV